MSENGYASMFSGGTNGTPVPVPKTEQEAQKALTGEPMTLSYKASIPYLFYFSGGAFPVGIMQLLADIESMLLHPAVSLPYSYYKSGIANCDFEVKAKNPRVQHFIEEQLRRFWERSLDQAQNAYDYGWGGSEVLYRMENGFLTYQGLHDFHPLDVWVLTRAGRYRGVAVHNVPTTPDGTSSRTGAVNLWGPGRWPAKGFWLTHNNRFHRWYGRSQLYSAWRPWRRLAFRDGVEEVADGGVYRFAYGGWTVRYPPEDFARQDGGTDYSAARNRAREFAETAKAGVALALPNSRDDKGNYKWDITKPESVLNMDPLVNFIKYIKDEISYGIGVPPELLEASETGSGYSGRKIPLLGFYVGQMRNARQIVWAWKRQIGDPLVKWNFGSDEPYTIEPHIILPADLAGDQGQPQPGQPGAQQGGMGGLLGALQGGAGQEEQPEQAPNLQGGQAGAGSQGLQLSASEWEYYQGPRGGHGWKNVKTDEIVYQKERPGSRGHSPAHSTSPRRAGKIRSRITARLLRTPAALGASTSRLVKRLGRTAWGKLSERAKGRLLRTWRVGKAVEHKLMFVFSKTQQLAVEMARQRGLGEDYARKLARLLATADLVSSWTVNFPAVTAARHNPLLGKVAAWLPVASLAYVATSTVKNPFAAIRAARQMISRHTHATLATLSTSQEQMRQTAALVLDRLIDHADDPHYEALLYAGLDRTKSLESAVALADEASQGRSGRHLSLGDEEVAPEGAGELTSPNVERILDDALAALSRLQRRVQRALLAEMRRDPLAQALGRARKILASAQPRLARLLTDAQLAAALTAMSKLARKMPEPAEEEQPSLEKEPPALLPEAPWHDQTPPQLGAGEEAAQAPSAHLPLIEAAVEDLKSRKVLTRDQFDALSAEARQQAFTVAGVESEAALEKIKQCLAEAVARGQTREDFAAAVEQAVGAGNFLSPAHMETVFRNGVQSAYSNGQAKLLENEIADALFPYATIDYTDDDRVRPEHRALCKHGLQGTNWFRRDDPVFQLFRPPWAWGCRCQWTARSVRDAADRGIEEAKLWLKTGLPPVSPAHVAMPPFRPDPAFQRVELNTVTEEAEDDAWTVLPTEHADEVNPPERPPCASTQINLPEELATLVLDLGRQIPDSWLADDGREEQSHVTCLYGIEEA